MNREQRLGVLQKIISQVREKEFPYAEREKKPIDWTSYDLAQCHEIADMLDLIRELVDSVVARLEPKRPEKCGPGRPPTPHGDVAKVLLLQSYLGVPNRVAEGLVILFKEKLGLSKEFSYKTIERGYDRKAVTRFLNAVFDLTNEPVNHLEKVFSVDGSGTPTSVKQNYASDRDRQNAKRSQGSDSETQHEQWAPSTSAKHDYVYKEAIIGTRFKLFAGWRSTTDHSIGETSLFPSVFRQAIGNHPDMEMMLGDGAFATRPMCQTVGESGVTPRFLPRRNATLKRKGVKGWVDMLWDLVDDPQSWLSDYHKRSLSETGFSVLVRRHPGPLRKRLDPRRETEDFLRGIVYNVRRLCYLRYTENLRISFAPFPWT